MAGKKYMGNTNRQFVCRNMWANVVKNCGLWPYPTFLYLHFWGGNVSVSFFPSRTLCRRVLSQNISIFFMSLSPLITFLSDPSPIIGFLIDLTLACEDASSKLVEVVTVADVDAEKQVDDILVQLFNL